MDGARMLAETIAKLATTSDAWLKIHAASAKILNYRLLTKRAHSLNASKQRKPRCSGLVPDAMEASSS